MWDTAAPQVTFPVKRIKNPTTNLMGRCGNWQLCEISQALNQELGRCPFIYLFIPGHISSLLLYRAGNTAAEFGWLASWWRRNQPLTLSPTALRASGDSEHQLRMSPGAPNSTPQTSVSSQTELLECAEVLHRTNNWWLYLKDNNLASQMFHHHWGDSFFHRTPPPAPGSSGWAPFSSGPHRYLSWRGQRGEGTQRTSSPKPLYLQILPSCSPENEA